jgi:hypothetical protein
VNSSFTHGSYKQEVFKVRVLTVKAVPAKVLGVIDIALPDVPHFKIVLLSLQLSLLHGQQLW